MDLHQKFPAIDDLRRRARKRIPHFVWEYLDSGTGTEATTARNRTALDRVGFQPSILHGPIEPGLGTRFLGRDFPVPFGMAPIGMSGLMWPRAEILLAEAAKKAGIPYSISTVATRTPEDMAPHIGPDAWYQLYPPKDPEIRRDMIDRIKAAGFSGLILTVDVPASSRRERQVRSGLTSPPALTARLWTQIVQCPAWAMGMAQTERPTMKTIEKYVDKQLGLPSTAHIGYILRTSPDIEYVKWLRDAWDGPFIIKGVMRADDAAALEDVGVDALWVSNHAGRQFDGAMASIEALPKVREATALPLIFDSGIEGGLDILRAIALGADFVMLGRAFHFALGAMGEAGPAHLIDLLKLDMVSNMGQLGAATLGDLPTPITLS
ncbi:alpha-hydroxy acid oxidase [Chachezhania antarctica]|uniref:alpha-hydroxy acid oxidase n=1 Tax=Chachezhania antarctica TaxID=2340860 RepID=UPI0019699535|nr:alpha-hydroxy acid oxidase [Chachezhania antarctica]|tara:strand:+ start:1079 stop:2215 length:1137 start_codon:yes stop_codon:yes gene_type:complete